MNLVDTNNNNKTALRKKQSSPSNGRNHGSKNSTDDAVRRQKRGGHTHQNRPRGGHAGQRNGHSGGGRRSRKPSGNDRFEGEGGGGELSPAVSPQQDPRVHSHHHGSGKGNANHLLSFTYGSARQPAPRRGHNSSKHNYNERKKSSPQAHVNRRQFLQANCHFVMSLGFDGQGGHSKNPDLGVKWDMVEQVRVLAPEKPDCPICLDPPIAPRITDCGHTFCYSCILQYLEISDRKWSRCPLCFESVYEKQLRPVHFKLSTTYEENEEISFVLVKKPRGSIDVTCMCQDDDVELEWFDRISLSSPFSQFLKQDFNDLVAALKDPEVDGLASIYIRMAMEKVSAELNTWEQTAAPLRKQLAGRAGSKEGEKVRIENGNTNGDGGDGGDDGDTKSRDDAWSDDRETANGDRKTSSSRTLAPQGVARLAPITTPPVNQGGTEGQAVNQGGTEGQAHESGTGKGQAKEEDGPPGKAPAASKKLNPNAKTFEFNVSAVEFTPGGVSAKPTPVAEPQILEPEDEENYYFFQASDAQCLFLHAMARRYLKAEYTYVNRFPHRIKGRLLLMESMVQNDNFRRRVRYLAHLPLSTNFKVALIDISHLLSPANRDAFNQEVRQLKKKLAKARKQAEALAKKREAQHQQLSPEFSMEDFPSSFFLQEPLELADTGLFPTLNDNNDDAQSAIGNGNGNVNGSGDRDSVNSGNGDRRARAGSAGPSPAPSPSPGFWAEVADKGFSGNHWEPVGGGGEQERSVRINRPGPALVGAWAKDNNNSALKPSAVSAAVRAPPAAPESVFSPEDGPPQQWTFSIPLPTPSAHAAAVADSTRSGKKGKKGKKKFTTLLSTSSGRSYR